MKSVVLTLNSSKLINFYFLHSPSRFVGKRFHELNITEYTKEFTQVKSPTSVKHARNPSVDQVTYIRI